MGKIEAFTVEITSSLHISYVEEILLEIERSARERGTGIARRDITYIENKIREGMAIIAFSSEGKWAGFCYIESWSNRSYVVNSGLIVKKEFRGSGIAREIKKACFVLSRNLFPQAKIFGLTTGGHVMKINHQLGYRPVTFDQLTSDISFWNGCKSCVNYQILESKQFSNCLCTAMLFDPKVPSHLSTKKEEAERKIISLYSKMKKIKRIIWKK